MGGLSGVYSSHTGATGVYPVSGWSPTISKHAENRPISLCVSWNPIDYVEELADGHWVSVMSGVRYADAPGDAPQIQMLHGLVAFADSGHKELGGSGIRAETLTFRKLYPANTSHSDTKDVTRGRPATPVRHFTLTNQNPRSDYSQVSCVSWSDGSVTGSIQSRDTLVSARGFLGQTVRQRVRSIVLSASNGSDESRSIGFSGFIDGEAGVAMLQLFDAAPVPYHDKYTAVTLGHETFFLEYVARDEPPPTVLAG